MVRAAAAGYLWLGSQISLFLLLRLHRISPGIEAAKTRLKGGCRINCM